MQRLLYTDVMLENYRNMLAVGKNSPGLGLAFSPLRFLSLVLFIHVCEVSVLQQNNRKNREMFLGSPLPI